VFQLPPTSLRGAWKHCPRRPCRGSPAEDPQATDRGVGGAPGADWVPLRHPDQTVRRAGPWNAQGRPFGWQTLEILRQQEDRRETLIPDHPTAMLSKDPPMNICAFGIRDHSPPASPTPASNSGHVVTRGTVGQVSPLFFRLPHAPGPPMGLPDEFFSLCRRAPAFPSFRILIPPSPPSPVPPAVIPVPDRHPRGPPLVVNPPP